MITKVYKHKSAVTKIVKFTYTGLQYECLTAGNFKKSVIKLHTSNGKSLCVVELVNIKYFERHSKFLFPIKPQ